MCICFPHFYNNKLKILLLNQKIGKRKRERERKGNDNAHDGADDEEKDHFYHCTFAFGQKLSEKNGYQFNMVHSMPAYLHFLLSRSPSLFHSFSFAHTFIRSFNRSISFTPSSSHKIHFMSAIYIDSYHILKFKHKKTTQI